MILISQIDSLLLNEYNKALDYKTSHMGRIIGFRSIFLGSSFTLLATIFTVSVLEIWVYILIISFIIGLLIGLLAIEYRTDVKVGKIDHYCNYIQVLIRENLLDDPKTKKFKESQSFLPLSFYISKVKENNFSIETRLDEYNKISLDHFIKKPIGSDSIKVWFLKSERFALIRLIILFIFVLIVLVISVASIGQPINIGWFDIYTLSQLLFGVATFSFLSLFYTIPKSKEKEPIFSLLFVFILSLVLIVMWEVLSNTLFIFIGLSSMDSPQNISSDILFGLLGEGIVWIFALNFFEKKKNVWNYYLLTTIFFGIFITLEIVLNLFFPT